MRVLLQEVRLKEGIVRLQPQEEPLRSELLSGKFTVLVGAAAIPMFPAMCQAACCSVAAPPAGIVSNHFFCPSFFTSEEP